MILDGYKVRFYAHCGMAYDIAQTDDITADGLQRMREEASGFINRRIARGYSVDEVSRRGNEIARYELTEPEDARMVPDDAGLLTIEPIAAWTKPCFDCGDEVRVGDACDCRLPIEDTDEEEEA